ncbi:MAG: 1,4-alpha-glucan branching protein GlgB [Clostridia bacterium]|nr:1,4-alpha-glucan branching protein GlgB [Clostridia bacterium]
MRFDRSTQSEFECGDCGIAYRFMGCKLDEKNDEATFRVWAPSACGVFAVGDFNGWDTEANPLTRVTDAGIWETSVKGVKRYDNYKYYIETAKGGIYKSDPYAFHSETHDATASKAYPLDVYKFTDGEYMANRSDAYKKPVNIYECHIGSWRRYPDGNCFSYRKFADEIVPYLKEMSYTHIELMGIAEYPYDASWGYQVTAYYAPTSRYGTPEDFAYLVDRLHGAGIGVILDWVPGHFPKNGNGLYEFDGGPLYEPSDELRKEHKEWGTRCFDYRRGEVSSFLISNALYWLDVFHIDGLRVDAVASMLYLDYGRTQWRPNEYGGKENLDAVEFFRRLNKKVFEKFPHTMMIAEESTAWPMVTKPADVGGLGFNFKWNMGWMNDTLSYAKTDPLWRGGLHNNLTFSMTYAFSENYILPISHDEVVYGKCSLLCKMPGTYEQKFAGWRNYLMNMMGHPGKKLTFMGTEYAQFDEWNFSSELDWKLLDFPTHSDARRFSRMLNKIYVENSPLWEIEDGWDGYNWLVADDSMQNVIAYERRNKKGDRLVFVINFSLSEWKDYRIGVEGGTFERLLYSDVYGFGEGGARFKSEKKESHGKSESIALDLAPMSGYIFKVAAKKPTAKKTGTAPVASAKKGTAPAQKKTAAKKPQQSKK